MLRPEKWMIHIFQKKNRYSVRRLSHGRIHNEKNNIFVLCFDDCADAGIGKRRHGVHFGTVVNRLKLMGRWTKTYEAHGRTIEVDVPIIVPEVNEFPVFSVEPYYAVYEQRLTRDGTMLEKIGEDGWCSVYAESNLFSEEGITGEAKALDLDDFEQVNFNANYSSPRDDA